MSVWAQRWLPILCVLWLAAALRWAQPGLVEFKYDEAHLTGMALGVVDGTDWPLLSGGTTLRIPRGALDVYLLALPLALIARQPESAVWFTAAMGVLAVALTYVLGRRAGGRRVGLLAALFMAANPWLVAYDRKLWAHIQVVLSVGLLLLAWEVVVAGRRRLALWFPILAAMQYLCHVLALLQALSWMAAMLVAPRRWWSRWTAWGMVGAGVLLTPYVWALFNAWHGQPLLTPSLVGDGAETPDRWRFAVHVLFGDGISSLAGLTAADHPAWRAATAIAWLMAALTLVGLLRVVAWTRIPQRRQGAWLLLAWLAGPLALLALSPIAVYPQYWTVLLPLPALFAALGWDSLAAGLRGAAGRRWPLSVAWATILATALIWAMAYLALLAALGRGAGGEAFGVPLQRWQQALAEVRARAQHLGVDQVRVAVRGVDPGLHGDPAAVAVLIGNPPWARFVAPTDPPALLLSADRPSLYLWTLADLQTERMLTGFGERVWRGTLAQGLPPADLYELPAAQDLDLAYTVLDPPLSFDAGLQLVGYRWPVSAQANQPFEVMLIWRVTEPSPDVRNRDFTAFNHVLTHPGDERVAQVDGLALLSRDWWPGDVLIQPYRLTLPAGEYVWRLGLYSRADGGRAQLLSGGDAIDLGPFGVR